MNISIEDVIEYLSKTKNPVQLVKHYDEVPKSKKTFPMIVQRKYDGVYCILVVIGGRVYPYSRTGKLLCIRDSFPIDPEDLCEGVYITELCNDLISLENLSGLVSPNRTSEWDYTQQIAMSKSYFMFHDYLTLCDFLEGQSKNSYMERYNTLVEVLPRNLECNIVRNIVVQDESEIDFHLAEAIVKGYEGIVIKDIESDWVAGHKGYRAMKLVRGVSLDLLCTGVKYGKGKREGQIAALEFEYKGNKFYADLGRGWDDVRRGNLTEAYELNRTLEDAPNGETNPVGKIWEVKALQLSSTGKALRLPKAERIRWDKEWQDV